MEPARSIVSIQHPAIPPLSRILEPVESDLRAVEEILQRSLESDVEIVRLIGKYVSEGGGKRIRPALLLLCARMAGYRGEQHRRFAAVFELIHTATLVHDDVIDGSPLRRGRSTVHARWGNHLTVLFGDHIYLTAMNEALRADDLRPIKILCEITLQMIQGEIIQAHLNGRTDIAEEEHLEVMRRKTALLFSGCARVAAYLAGLPPDGEDELAAFGLNLGMAYQIVDDLLDLTADPKILGKPVASDLREGRLTLPLIYLLEGGEPRHREMVGHLLKDRDFDRVPLAEVVAELKKQGSLERTRSLALRYCDGARERLDSFPDSPARRSLLDVCDFITSRTF